MRWLIYAAVLTAMFVSLPLSLSTSPSSSLPQLTTSKAEAWVTYRRARVTYRRAYRRGYRQAYRYGVGVPGLYGYPYQPGYYAYRHVYAPPWRAWGWGGWHAPHWGPVRGWHWWR